MSTEFHNHLQTDDQAGVAQVNPMPLPDFHPQGENFDRVEHNNNEQPLTQLAKDEAFSSFTSGADVDDGVHAPTHMARGSTGTTTSSSGFVQIDPSQFDTTNSSGYGDGGSDFGLGTAAPPTHKPPPSRSSVVSSPSRQSQTRSSRGVTSSADSLAKPGVLLHVISFLHGSISLLLVMIQMVFDMQLFKKLTKEDSNLVKKARQNIWSLTLKPYGTLHHRFLTLPTGFRLHYVTNEATLPSPTSSTKPRNLVIFIHGFPDSWHIWNNQLRSSALSSSAILVAIDLPGYGGSDSLPTYSADNVLNTLALSIAGLRDQYLVPSAGHAAAKVIAVSHDWGTILSFRLAAEAPALVDRHITMNCPYYPVMEANIKDHVVSAAGHFQTYLAAPFSRLPALLTGISTMQPLFGQIRKSWYISAFKLPLPITKLMCTLGDGFNRTGDKPEHKWFFLRVVATEASPDLKHRRGPYDPECAPFVASAIGPGMEECLEASKIATSSSSGVSTDQVYSPSVRLRAPTGGWMDHLGVYRGDILITKWYRSQEVENALARIRSPPLSSTESASAPQFSWVNDETVLNRPNGKIGVPVTILWGTEDLAINAELSLDNIENWFVKARPTLNPDGTSHTHQIHCGSQVVKIHGAGHWLPEGKVGKDAVIETVAWALSTFEEPEKTPKLVDWLSGRIKIGLDEMSFPVDTTGRI